MAKYQLLKSALLGTPIKRKPVVMVGAGIAGLLLGFRLKKAGVPFTLLEKSERAGGLIQTRSTDIGYIESAANGFLWCRELQEVADTLGLPILPPGKATKARYIVRNGHLTRLPLSLWDFPRLLAGIFSSQPDPFTTVEEFGLRVLGEKATHYLLDPAMGGIYAADIHRLSLPGALPMIAKAYEHSHRLVPGFLAYRKTQPATPKGTSGTHSFQGGMSTLVEALSNYLSSHIQYGVDGLAAVSPQDEVVFSTPAYVTARAFPQGEVRSMLEKVPYTPILSVKMGFRRADIPQMKKGFGALIPRAEGKTLLGILFNHDIFPDNTKPEYYSFTCIMKEDPFSETRPLFAQTDDQLVALALKELRDVLGGTGDPILAYVDRWERGIPLYTPEHYRHLLQLEQLLPQRFPHWRLFGNYTGQISVRGMAQVAANVVSQ